MTDHDLATLLERSADRIHVGHPPVPEMLVDAGRLRRRHAALIGGAMATVLAVAGSTALLASLDPGPGGPDLPTDNQPADPAPDGTRLVGYGSSAIAVPEDWATNALRCGTAERPTVVVDVAAIESCSWLGPQVFDNVWIEPGVNESMFTAVEDFEIDGVAAQRDATTCATQGRARPCSATVYLPSADVSYRAEAASTARVEEILSWIRIVPDLVAVPGHQTTNSHQQDDDAGEHYRAELEAAGLEVEVVTETRPGFPAGYVLDVTPAPGTMLEPGAVVTMTEVAEPRGPADEVSVEINSVGPDASSSYRGLTDRQVRAGAEIRLDLGATIWVYGSGKRIGTLAGEVTGSSLVLDDWEEGPNYGRSWEAVERGTSTLTVTITADGRRIELGTVTVIVR